MLEANDGVWPGVRIPSHTMFLWASGSELTSILEADHMPNKYIPKDLRYVESFYFATFFFLLLMSKTYCSSSVLDGHRRQGSASPCGKASNEALIFLN